MVFFGYEGKHGKGTGTMTLVSLCTVTHVSWCTVILDGAWRCMDGAWRMDGAMAWDLR